MLKPRRGAPVLFLLLAAGAAYSTVELGTLSVTYTTYPNGHTARNTPTDGSVWGETKNTSVPLADHGVPGTVDSNLDGYFPGNEFGTWMDATAFPLAGCAGKVPVVQGPIKYDPAVAVTNKQVKIKNVARSVQSSVTYPGNPNANPPIPATTTNSYIYGEGTVVAATFDANCHMLAAKVAQKSTGAVEQGGENRVVTDQPPSGGGGGVKVWGPLGPLTPDFIFNFWICGTGATHIFHFTVTNNYDCAATFHWPAVRTPEHPDGWTATVDPESTLEYSCEVGGAYVMVPGSSGEVTVTNEAQEVVVVATHSTPAFCPASSVDIPNPVGALVATNAPTLVSLSWVNGDLYDTIQVLRSVDGGPLERTGWEIDGEETSFIDDDPPAEGEVTYEVIGVTASVGSDESPSTSVIR